MKNKENKVVCSGKHNTIHDNHKKNSCREVNNKTEENASENVKSDFSKNCFYLKKLFHPFLKSVASRIFLSSTSSGLANPKHMKYFCNDFREEKNKNLLSDKTNLNANSTHYSIPTQEKKADRRKERRNAKEEESCNDIQNPSINRSVFLSLNRKYLDSKQTFNVLIDEQKNQRKSRTIGKDVKFFVHQNNNNTSNSSTTNAKIEDSSSLNAFSNLDNNNDRCKVCNTLSSSVSLPYTRGFRGSIVERLLSVMKKTMKDIISKSQSRFASHNDIIHVPSSSSTAESEIVFMLEEKCIKQPLLSSKQKNKLKMIDELRLDEKYNSNSVYSDIASHVTTASKCHEEDTSLSSPFSSVLLSNEIDEAGVYSSNRCCGSSCGTECTYVRSLRVEENEYRRSSFFFSLKKKKNSKKGKEKSSNSSCSDLYNNFSNTYNDKIKENSSSNILSVKSNTYASMVFALNKSLSRDNTQEKVSHLHCCISSTCPCGFDFNRSARFDSQTSPFPLAAVSSSKVPENSFSWKVAEELLRSSTIQCENFSLCGVKMSDWRYEQIPTLGSSNNCSRAQKLYKACIDLVDHADNHSSIYVFVKKIPYAIWKSQLQCQMKLNGEFVTDGENFVMEAAALAFLQKYHPGISPHLYGLVEESKDSNLFKCPNDSFSFSAEFVETSKAFGDNPCTKLDDTHYMALVMEFYGEDLLDYYERRERESAPLSFDEKYLLQKEVFNLMCALHSIGLSHLDYTPENILIGCEGLKLCDFSKATPLWSNFIRHVNPLAASHDDSFSAPSLRCGFPPNYIYPFESCEPTVGKGAYMPPECWKVYWRLETEKIQSPLIELQRYNNLLDKQPFYFSVEKADIYMLGVLLFWIWTEGSVWRCSDYKQDSRYRCLVLSNFNFDLFQECRGWPKHLKEFLKSILHPNPLLRGSLKSLSSHSWWIENY